MVNEGRGTHEQFDYVPFSDPRVLSELICNRMKLDRSYIEKVYPSGLLSSCGGIIFNEQIISVYVDLDRLIETSPLTKKQRAVIELLMRGYTIQDIAEETNNLQSNISHIFARAIAVMINQHKKRWREVLLGEANTAEQQKEDVR